MENVPLPVHDDRRFDRDGAVAGRGELAPELPIRTARIPQASRNAERSVGFRQDLEVCGGQVQVRRHSIHNHAQLRAAVRAGRLFAGDLDAETVPLPAVMSQHQVARPHRARVLAEIDNRRTRQVARLERLHLQRLDPGDGDAASACCRIDAQTGTRLLGRQQHFVFVPLAVVIHGESHGILSRKPAPEEDLSNRIRVGPHPNRQQHPAPLRHSSHGRRVDIGILADAVELQPFGRGPHVRHRVGSHPALSALSEIKQHHRLLRRRGAKPQSAQQKTELDLSGSIHRVFASSKVLDIQPAPSPNATGSKSRTTASGRR